MGRSYLELQMTTIGYTRWRDDKGLIPFASHWLLNVSYISANLSC